MRANHQKAILTAMMDPGFYSHRVDTIVRHETHISTVFLTGPYVYKVKKPVNLGFLDFTTLEKRRRYCRQEVSLNRRLASDVYLGVLPVTLQQSGYTLNGSGETVETVVKMRQLSEADAMLPCLQQSRLTDADILALVDRLIGFYTHTPSAGPPQPTGKAAWEENLIVMQAFVGNVIDKARFSFISSAARAFYNRQKRVFERRVKKGRIRDGHGDLRCEHIYFTDDGIQIIDCIEFNDSLRILDIISDLAFLAMDLEYNGFDHLARLLIREFITRTGDVEALPLLDFYRCYRAMVRCKVSAFMLREISLSNARRQRLQAAADAYLALAHGYATAFSRPTLWVVCGLPASGKSATAKALADVYGLEVIRSDAVRKELLDRQVDPSGSREFEKGLYSAYATEVTYTHLFDLAQETLKRGHGVVIDATFSRDLYRRRVLDIAARRQVRPVFVECRAADAVLAERLRKRETEPSLSDARLIHLERFKQRYEPIIDIGPAIHITVDTIASPEDCLHRILLDDWLWNH
jgi:aminoglycoside phosphotransferase family enzyme/predicted kinase